MHIFYAKGNCFLSWDEWKHLGMSLSITDYFLREELDIWFMLTLLSLVINPKPNEKHSNKQG